MMCSRLSTRRLRQVAVLSAPDGIEIGPAPQYCRRSIMIRSSGSCEKDLVVCLVDCWRLISKAPHWGWCATESSGRGVVGGVAVTNGVAFPDPQALGNDFHRSVHSRTDGIFLLLRLINCSCPFNTAFGRRRRPPPPCPPERSQPPR